MSRDEPWLLQETGCGYGKQEAITASWRAARNRRLGRGAAKVAQIQESVVSSMMSGDSESEEERRGQRKAAKKRASDAKREAEQIEEEREWVSRVWNLFGEGSESSAWYALLRALFAEARWKEVTAHRLCAADLAARRGHIRAMKVRCCANFLDAANAVSKARGPIGGEGGVSSRDIASAADGFPTDAAVDAFKGDVDVLLAREPVNLRWLGPPRQKREEGADETPRVMRLVWPSASAKEGQCGFHPGFLVQWGGPRWQVEYVQGQDIVPSSAAQGGMVGVGVGSGGVTRPDACVHLVNGWRRLLIFLRISWREKHIDALAKLGVTPSIAQARLATSPFRTDNHFGITSDSILLEPPS